jgi:E3 ubiquitin-protein ligase HERC2
MYPDILISQLYMRVEPNDSSYMPSLVVISGGDDIHNLKELKTINIGSSEKLVSLLQDMIEVGYTLDPNSQNP